TYYRMYKYKVLPFRLTNGLAIYWQYINNILFNYLNNFYTAYLDNIIIYSKNKLEYKEYDYKINIKKLKFSIKRIKYLGFIISINGIKANLKKIAII
ncbi:DNA/RNA polymerase, partial [Cenococcum geophilum 1.58]